MFIFLLGGSPYPTRIGRGTPGGTQSPRSGREVVGLPGGFEDRDLACVLLIAAADHVHVVGVDLHEGASPTYLVASDQRRTRTGERIEHDSLWRRAVPDQMCQQIHGLSRGV